MNQTSTFRFAYVLGIATLEFINIAGGFQTLPYMKKLLTPADAVTDTEKKCHISPYCLFLSRALYFSLICSMGIKNGCYYSESPTMHRRELVEKSKPK
jgi:hypothetical protein